MRATSGKWFSTESNEADALATCIEAANLDLGAGIAREFKTFKHMATLASLLLSHVALPRRRRCGFSGLLLATSEPGSRSAQSLPWAALGGQLNQDCCPGPRTSPPAYLPGDTLRFNYGRPPRLDSTFGGSATAPQDLIEKFLSFHRIRVMSVFLSTENVKLVVRAHESGVT